MLTDVDPSILYIHFYINHAIVGFANKQQATKKRTHPKPLITHHTILALTYISCLLGVDNADEIL